MIGIDNHPLYMMRNHFLQSLNKKSHEAKKNRKRSVDNEQSDKDEQSAPKIRKTQDIPPTSSPQDACKNQVFLFSEVI